MKEVLATLDLAGCEAPLRLLYQGRALRWELAWRVGGNIRAQALIKKCTSSLVT